MRWQHSVMAMSLLLPASVPLQSAPKPPRSPLSDARAEALAADAEVRRLEQAAAAAKSDAERLRADQLAAAQAIAAAEARISLAEMEARITARRLARVQERLRREQQPVASLLAGLAFMARRPPLLAIMDRGSTDDFVRVRMLVDATVPVIRSRTAKLSAELRESERLRQAGVAARADLVRNRNLLAARKRAFADLEQKALQMAAFSDEAAVEAGDVALARGEEFQRLSDEATRGRSATALAAELARLGPAPLGPRTAAPDSAAPFAYRLPADAPVLVGLGEVSPHGIQSRGLTLGTPRGASVVAPAAGVIRFSGPSGDYDGVVIIDHGGGWMSLLINVASPLEVGTRVSAGDRLGRAIGPLGVELSRKGQHFSPAIIAGSSRNLSNRAKGG